METGATKNNESLKKACAHASQTMEKFSKEAQMKDIHERLKFCIGSYDFDKNPVGLLEVARDAYEALKTYKTQKPRKVSKQVLDKLEKAISKFNWF